jgi:hypothetical protein
LPANFSSFVIVTEVRKDRDQGWEGKATGTSSARLRREIRVSYNSGRRSGGGKRGERKRSKVNAPIVRLEEPCSYTFKLETPMHLRLDRIVAVDTDFSLPKRREELFIGECRNGDLVDAAIRRRRLWEAFRGALLRRVAGGSGGNEWDCLLEENAAFEAGDELGVSCSSDGVDERSGLPVDQIGMVQSCSTGRKRRKRENAPSVFPHYRRMRFAHELERDRSVSTVSLEANRRSQGRSLRVEDAGGRKWEGEFEVGWFCSEDAILLVRSSHRRWMGEQSRG